MNLRTLALSGLLGLLAACSSTEPPTPAPTKAPAPVADTVKVPPPLGPLPAWQRELSGQLLGVPVGAHVELALLVIDERNRPQKLLASSDLTGTNQPLAFQLRFNPEAFPQGARVELRGRASQSGQLILHLPSQRIEQANSQALGQLRFQPAP